MASRSTQLLELLASCDGYTRQWEEAAYDPTDGFTHFYDSRRARSSTPAVNGREGWLSSIAAGLDDALTVHYVHAPETEFANANSANRR